MCGGSGWPPASGEEIICEAIEEVSGGAAGPEPPDVVGGVLYTSPGG